MSSPQPTRPAVEGDPSEPVAAHPPADPAVTAVIVLAAGAGTRMRSALPKVLHPLAGRPLVWHAVRAAAALTPRTLVAVLGHGREAVGAYLDGAGDELPSIVRAVQAEQRGTGHAVACALTATGGLTGTVVVTYADVPLLRPETLGELVRAHHDGGHAVTVLTAEVDDPTGYGRVIRDADGTPAAIVEHKDADADQRAVREVNSGVYAFDGELLGESLAALSTDNASGELYLTDVLAGARARGRRVGAVRASDPVETEGVNDRVQLSEMAARLNARLVRDLQLGGVTVLDPRTTWVHADVRVDADTVLLPGTSLEAGTVVGSGCTIGPDTTLSACRVESDASVVRSHASGAVVGPGATVGPFSFLRPGTELGAGSKVGAYVEVKGSTLGEGAKVPHLSYVGDAEIGPGSNIGAGTITANYDGVRKSRTVVGRDAFVGTNSTLVAPVVVGPGSYVAAGSTVTADVPAGDLAVARQRQRTVRGWVLRRRPGTPTERAALAAGAGAPAGRDADGAPVSSPGTPAPTAEGDLTA
nr:bifunctional UDP-N-acetylglucosamine diphosphorylase/glucosamine-1-phosphate N-acetyltransferase GlmU [Nakamurella flavida]